MAQLVLINSGGTFTATITAAVITGGGTPLTPPASSSFVLINSAGTYTCQKLNTTNVAGTIPGVAGISAATESSGVVSIGGEIATVATVSHTAGTTLVIAGTAGGVAQASHSVFYKNYSTTSHFGTILGVVSIANSDRLSPNPIVADVVGAVPSVALPFSDGDAFNVPAERFVTGSSRISMKASGTLSSGLPIAGSVRISLTAAGTMSAPNIMVGAAKISLTATGVLASSIIVTGAAHINLTSQGVLSSTTAMSGAARIGLTATGVMSAQVNITGTARIGLTASGALSAPVNISGVARISLTARGSIAHQQAIAAVAAGAVTAWLVNTATGGHSTYSNFAFNSFFRLGNDYYGCSDAGFIKLDGTLDIATAIPWAIKTGITTFGSHNQKYVRDAQVVMRADDDVAFRIIVDEQIDVSNDIIPDDDLTGIHARRVKTPRGIEGTAWQFELSGTSAIADIKSLEVEPILSKRT